MLIKQEKEQKIAPFKFLDAYKEEDIDIFFGRKKETEELYQALSGVKHLLVYGPSGAGKTSLIECGLRNQFSDADWLALTIRRGSNISASTFIAINDALEEKIDLDPISGLPISHEVSFESALEQLFEESYQPIYLLFDQFEELLISGSKTEQERFFQQLNQLIYHLVPCRVLLIMREEFVGHLSEFEKLCPSIFQYRFRLEKIRPDDIQKIIAQTLIAPIFNTSFKVDFPDELAAAISLKLPSRRREIELTHVQVFLSELWDRAFKQTKTGELPILTKNLINPDDNLERILDSFLQKQFLFLEAIYGKKTPLEVLNCMISKPHYTKLQLTSESLLSALHKNNVFLKFSDLCHLLDAFIQQKILRIVKIDDQARYEITHDTLAFVIGKNLTEEIQFREKARQLYKFYTERQGLLSQEDLNHLRTFEFYFTFPKPLEERIKISERKINADKIQQEKEQQDKIDNAEAQVSKERKLRRQTSFVAILAILGAFISIIYYFNAKTANSNLANQTIATNVQRDSANAQRDNANAQRDSANIQKNRAIILVKEIKEGKKEVENANKIAKQQELEAIRNLKKMKIAEQKRISAEIKSYHDAAQRIDKMGDTKLADKIKAEAKKMEANLSKLIE